jgi:hypothetical protein
MPLSQKSNNEADILSRVLRAGDADLPVTVARALLRFRFPSEDEERMHELAVKNQADKLTAAEQQELSGYLRVGRLLDLLTAKARLSLAKNGHDA